VKGLEKPLITYLVQRARGRGFEAARRGVDGISTALVDRLAETERLHAAYRDLCTGGAGLEALFLVADAGIGKTRLLGEFSTWAATQPLGLRTLTARASERRMSQPYAVLRDLLTSLVPMRDSDPPAQARATWRAASSPLLDGDDDAVVLGHLLGLDFAEHEAVRGIAGDGRQIRDRGHHYACQWLRKLATGTPPLALLIDDLHWADEASLDFIAQLMVDHADLRLLVVGLARPTLYERRPDWGLPAGGQARIDLPQLDGQDSDALVLALLQRLDEVPTALRALIVERAEGNPYYIEELVNMLIDENVIVPGPCWQLQLANLRPTHLPTTLVGVLQARLDGLPDDLRHTLLQAAVVGHVFWDDALAALGVHSDEALQALAARQLIVPCPSSSLQGLREYSFKHHSLHQVCYDSVLKRHKRAAHATVARWLADRSGASRHELIAEHFERGGEPAQAIVHWQRAAEAAAARYANAAALAHAQRALALIAADDAERRFSLTLLGAKVLRTLSERDRLAATLVELTSLAEQLDDDRRRSEAAEQRARFHNDGGDAVLSLELARQSLAWSPDDAPECAARAQLLIASALSLLGRLEESKRHAEAGLARAHEAGVAPVEAMLLNQLGMDANNQGDPGAAIRLFEQALAHHRATSNRSNEAATLSNMAYAALILGLYDQAQAQFEATVELCRQIGQRHTEGIVQINLALVRQCLCDAAGALAHARRALSLLQQTGDRLGQAAALRAIGHAELALADLPRAGDSLRASRDMFDALGLGHLAIEAIAGQVLHALASRDIAAARGHVDVILDRQARGASLAGTDEPLRIGLACFLALAAAGDSRAAGVLAATHAELMARAATISDPVLRQGFIDNVPWHRELNRLWRQRSPD
jgi:predicted ATPase